jgi:hypothetical protein
MGRTDIDTPWEALTQLDAVKQAVHLVTGQPVALASAV